MKRFLAGLAVHVLECIGIALAFTLILSCIALFIGRDVTATSFDQCVWFLVQYQLYLTVAVSFVVHYLCWFPERHAFDRRQNLLMLFCPLITLFMWFWEIGDKALTWSPNHVE